MEQGKIRISLSIETKLLISLVSLTVVAVLGLSVTTIFLIQKDKRIYTFQAQATESQLVATEAATLAKEALNSLKLALSQHDAMVGISETARAGLKNILDNQSRIQSLALFEASPLGVKKLFNAQLSDAPVLDSATEMALHQSLQVPGAFSKQSYNFMNLSKVGGPPAIGILLADTEHRSPDGKFIAALGLIPLSGFAKGISGSDIHLVTLDGLVLYSSNPAFQFTTKVYPEDGILQAARGQKLAQGAHEFTVDGAHFLGSFVRPGFGMAVLNKMSWRTAMRAAYDITEKAALTGFMVLGAAIILAILFAKTLTRPLLTLYGATREVAGGNFDVSLKPSSKDEIGALSTAFNQMSQQIKLLIKERVEKVRMENELAIASAVQHNLIPPEFCENPYLEIRSHYESASECGGDWWGFFSGNKKLSILIADATGHGLPSALITAAARSCFSVLHKYAQENPAFTFSPEEMLKYANRAIFESANGNIMMTFFAGVFDFETMTFSYANAGHNPPWVLSPKGDGTFKLSSLAAKGLRLGEGLNLMEVEPKSIPIHEGDLFFFYTDGLTEGMNPSQEMFGKKRVRALVEEMTPQGPKAVIDRLLKEFKAHNQNKALDDDITLAVLQVKPLQGPIS